MNLDTARAQQQMNMTNQVNPYGSISYDPSGTTSYVDSQGNTVTIPQYTQTTTFSPEQQKLYNATTSAQTGMARLAGQQAQRLGKHLQTPFDFNNRSAQDWAYDLASSRILPQQERSEEALRTRLINSGLRPGTQAWDTEMSRMTMANTDQMNQLMLQGRGQAFDEALSTYQMPIDAMTALMGGAQNQAVNPAAAAGPTPQVGVGGTDLTGLVQNNYSNEMDAYNTQMASRNAGMGGLFGLAGQLGAAAIPVISDRRLKEDIERVGTLDNGLPVYRFRYKSGGPVQIGLMSDDVRSQVPDAVSRHTDGFDRVDYGMATL